MTGRIVYTPAAPAERHECFPPDGMDLEPPRRPNPSRPSRGSTHRNVHLSAQPPGTVWACDECDTTWVSGRGQWRREGRVARWRRERNQRETFTLVSPYPDPKAGFHVPPKDPE